MATRFETVEVWIVVDAQGDVGQGHTQEAALENYAENIGDIAESNGFRLVCVKVRVPLPETCVVEIEAEAPALEAPTARSALQGEHS